MLRNWTSPSFWLRVTMLVRPSGAFVTKSHERSLNILKIEVCMTGGRDLSLRFAQKYLNHEKFSDMFPKNPLTIRLRGKYWEIEHILQCDSLEERREKLWLKFAKACLSNEKLSDIFPRNNKKHCMEKRGKELFQVKRAKTERLRKSAVVSMQKLLNKEALEKKAFWEQLVIICQWTMIVCNLYHCENKTRNNNNNNKNSKKWSMFSL